MDVQKYVEKSMNPPPAMLTNPFPTQHQQMVAQIPTPQTTNHNARAPSGARPSSVNILMENSIDLTAQAKSYEKQTEG